jgi:hypothetical protein
MTPTQSGFAAFRGPADRTVFEPGFVLWTRVGNALRRLVKTVLMLPDRGARAEKLPPEFFRFPPV